MIVLRESAIERIQCALFGRVGIPRYLLLKQVPVPIRFQFMRPAVLPHAPSVTLACGGTSTRKPPGSPRSGGWGRRPPAWVRCRLPSQPQLSLAPPRRLLMRRGQPRQPITELLQDMYTQHSSDQAPLVYVPDVLTHSAAARAVRAH
jgi:hypothetical protein